MKMQDCLEGDIIIFTLSGKMMGGQDTTFFHGRIHEYLYLNKRNFVIDLNKVEWSDSSGLGMLISGLCSVRRAGGAMVLANITNIRNLLAITRLLQVFECYDSLDDARSSLILSLIHI